MNISGPMLSSEINLGNFIVYLRKYAYWYYTVKLKENHIIYLTFYLVVF